MRQRTEILDYQAFINGLGKLNISVSKLDIGYNRADSRCWTAVINPGKDNVLVTFHANKRHLGDQTFDVISSEKIYTDLDPEFVYDVIDQTLENQ